MKVKPFKKIDLKLDVSGLQKKLTGDVDYFGCFNQRCGFKDSPHREAVDIWVRYNNVEPFLKSKDFSSFADEHDSVWYPVYKDLPEVKDIVFALMNKVEGERLGGVLITKIAPGKQIYAHTDSGWHAEYYDKFYIPILNKAGSTFYFNEGSISPQEGEVFQFNNSYEHWVKNDSNSDRIAMVICIKTENTMMNKGEM